MKTFLSYSMKWNKFPLQVVRLPIKGTRNLVSMTTNEVEKNLEMFPEYKVAQEHMIAGRFQKAVPNYERVFDSLQSALGLESPLTTHLLYQLANGHRYAGNFQKAQSLLSQYTPKLTQNIEAKLKLNQLQTVVYLLSRHFESALRLSDTNLEECERLSNHENTYSKYLSSLYGSLGISHLVNGNIHDAETFLQMSCRWAENPTEHLISATNNGSLVWYKLANEENPKLRFNLWDAQYENINSKVQFLSTNKDGTTTVPPKIDLNSEIYKEYLVHVLNGWIEAVDEAQKGQIHIGTTGCGPMNMTGLQSKDVTMVAPSAPAAPANGAADDAKAAKPLSEVEKQQKFEQALAQDVHFAIAYAHLLYQISELQEITGKYSESSEYLGSAMKALNAHSTNLITYPLLGKILRQIGYYHMSNLQSVTSEGLYRAAIEKLSSPFADFDYRYQYETHITKGFYGKLLTKWEKREAVGENHKTEASELLKAWKSKNLKHLSKDQQKHHHDTPFYPLTSTIQFPVDYLK